MKFENFICNKNDDIDNAAFNLLCTIVTTSEYYNGDCPEIEWNMETIGQLVDYAENLLIKSGYNTCHPFYEGDEETPCYLGEDCERTDCPFRKERGIINDVF